MTDAAKIVEFLRVQDGYGEWHEAADVIEREFITDRTRAMDELIASSADEYESPSARITGDKDRSNQSRALTTLAWECHRLRTVLRYIADVAYVDHHSGNANFEYLQGIARDALKKEPTP